MVNDMKQAAGFGLLTTPALVLLLFLPLILLIFFLLAPPSLAQGFEEDGFNGTTYILAKMEAEVIVPANGTSFNLSLPYKSEIRLFDSNGSEVPVETEVQFWRGSHQYQVVSEEVVTGHLNYTTPITDQRFVALAEEGRRSGSFFLRATPPATPSWGGLGQIPTRSRSGTTGPSSSGPTSTRGR